MALKKVFSQPETGAEFPNGYLRVQSVWFAHGSPNIRVDVAAFKDEQARRDGKQPVGLAVYHFPLSNDQPMLPYAYAQLKTHPDFADAADVFDPIIEVEKDPAPVDAAEG